MKSKILAVAMILAALTITAAFLLVPARSYLTATDSVETIGTTTTVAPTQMKMSHQDETMASLTTADDDDIAALMQKAIEASAIYATTAMETDTGGADAALTKPMADTIHTALDTYFVHIDEFAVAKSATQEIATVIIGDFLAATTLPIVRDHGDGAVVKQPAIQEVSTVITCKRLTPTHCFA